MNVKRFVGASIAVFVFIFFYEWGFHGKLLQDSYAQIPNFLRRPKEDFMQHMGWLVVGQFILSAMFCLVYTRAEERKRGVGFAIGYGIAMGVLFGGTALIDYAVQPMPLKLIGLWCIGGIVEFAIAGAILGAIYRPAPAPQ